MAEVVNLKRVRKAVDRVKKRAQADENAAVFGLKNSQKTSAKREQALASKHLDGHKISDD